MTETVPSFTESLKEAECRLSRLLEGRCEISIHHELDSGLIADIETIDHEKFRRELWYDRDELDERKEKRGFLCLIARLDGRAVAFDYGYEADEEGAFFSDTTATRIEGKGVGSTLFALESKRNLPLSAVTRDSNGDFSRNSSRSPPSALFPPPAPSIDRGP